MNEPGNFLDQQDKNHLSCYGASPFTDGSFFTDQTVDKEKMTVASVTFRAKLRLDDGSTSPGENFLSKLSHINGAINKMTKEQLQVKLAEFKLNTSGVKDVLKKRLKNHYRRQRFLQCNKPLTESEVMQYEYLVVIDFEATCSETNENFVHEIIEFPAVLINVQHLAVCNIFQRFCKPKLNPRLTEFCTKLTGISQQQVDKSKDFTEVLKEFEEWLAIHKLGSDYKFAVLTDGPWDMSRFLKTQADLSGISFPQWAKQWINLRRAYSAFYDCGRVNLHKMLDELGMKFQGRPHCGLDDARNIAAIALRLLQDGCVMRVNEHYRDMCFVPHGLSKPSKLNRSKSNHKNKVKETVEVEQEGENLHELMEYIRIQKS